MSLPDSASVSGIWVLALAAFVVGRLAEGQIHRRNYQALRAMGAVEKAPWLMRGYYAVTVVVVPGAFLEQYLMPGPPTEVMVLLGSMLAGVAVLFRLWAIRSLGVFWTMRCMALPGMRPSPVGPYRLLDNPEYLSRLIEGSGICLLMSAELTLAVYVTLTAAYGLYLAGMERRHFDATSKPPRPRPARSP